MHTRGTRERAYQKMKDRREKWLQENGPCQVCQTWDNLEVDHIDPTSKISHVVWSWREDRMLEELAKCQVLCRDCHEEKTAEENRIRNGGLRHGTETMYAKYKCRCEPCKGARRIKKAANRRRRKAEGLSYQ